MKTFTASLAVATALSVSVLAASPVLEPGTQKFIDAVAASGGAPIYTLTPEAARNLLRTVQTGAKLPEGVSVKDSKLPVGPTGETRIRILRPTAAKGALPALVYFHGAGWVMGDTLTHDRLVRELVVKAGIAVVFVDYERSPEARYPTAIEQDYAVTKYVAEHGAKLGLDPKRIAIGCDSVGGNMTAVVAQLAQERGGPALKAQLLFYPVTDASLETGSYKEFANGPWLTKPAMDWFWNAYLPQGANRADPKISPLNASKAQLAKQPQALVITAENDVLRDEGEAYARKLIEAGVVTTVTRYNATIHDFVMLNALSATPATRAALDQAASFLKAALR